MDECIIGIGNGTKFYPVHFGKAERWIEETTWYDENGEEQIAGGYNKAFLMVKKPEFGRTADLKTDFKFDDRISFELENDKLSAPKNKIVMDKNNVWWK